MSFILTVSYVPNMIWWQVELLDHDANYPVLSMAANTITVFNSCSNPLIYALRTEAFKRLMLRWFKTDEREIDVPD